MPGAGRKRISTILDSAVFDWILNQREKLLRVSRRSIQEKARELFVTLENNPHANFRASNGWLQKFMVRHRLSLRRRTTLAQKDPDDLNKKIASYIMYVSNTRKSKKIASDDLIVAMDETSVFFDMISNTTVTPTGSKSVPMQSTGHQKEHATIVLAAKADGTKLKPYVVFKKSVREVQKLQETKGVIVRSSNNGWMNQDLTVDWLKSVFGKFSFQRRLLAWDSYRCHISAETTNELKQYNTDVAVIPGGCTKYIQAPDVSWNKPFKQKITEFYDNWMSGSEQKEYTRGGNLKAPSKALLLQWILNAWKELPTAMIIKSFKACALSICLEGAEDHLIHCIKPGEACEKAAELLHMARLQGQIEELTIAEDIEETDANEILIDSDIEDETVSTSESEEIISYDEDSSEEDL